MFILFLSKSWFVWIAFGLGSLFTACRGQLKHSDSDGNNITKRDDNETILAQTLGVVLLTFGLFLAYLMRLATDGQLPDGYS